MTSTTRMRRRGGTTIGISHSFAAAGGAGDAASEVTASMKQHASDAGDHIKDQASQSTGQLKEQAS